MANEAGRRPALALAACAALVATVGSASIRSTPDQEWLTRLNLWRAAAGLGAVADAPELSRAAALHSRYCLENGVVTHTETAGNAWFSREGQVAGRVGNVLGHSDATASGAWPVDVWMTGPFHSLRLLDPRLERVGYGLARRKGGASSWIALAATLDAVRGRRAARRGDYPARFPADEAIVPLPLPCRGSACYAGDERPDPLTSCPGYDPPTGFPVSVQLGPGANTTVTGSTFREDGRDVPHCVLTSDTYVNPDAGEQARGRRVLAEFGAVVVIPRQPLRPGRRYDTELGVGGARLAWGFTVRGVASPADARRPALPVALGPPLSRMAALAH